MNTQMQDLVKQWERLYKKSRRIPGAQLNKQQDITQQQERIVRELARLTDPTSGLAMHCPVCGAPLRPFSLYCRAGHMRFSVPVDKPPPPPRPKTPSVSSGHFPTFRRIKPQEWHFLDLGGVRKNKSHAESYRRRHGSLTRVEYHLEEFVRQWVIQVLIDTYQYPRSWIGTQLTIEEPVQIGATYCRADIALKNRRGEPFLFVETKATGASDQEIKRAEGQLKSYLSATHSALIGMVTDGRTTRFIRKQTNPNTFITLADLPSLKDVLQEGLIDQADLADTTDPPAREDDPAIVPLGTPAQHTPSTYPSVQQYIAAFRALADDMSANQRAMLTAHYHAPQHTMTMTELAQAVGYASYRGANLQYGRLGSLLCEQLHWHQSINISVLVSFISPDQSPTGQWLLVLHPEVVAALKQLRWV